MSKFRSTRSINRDPQQLTITLLNKGRRWGKLGIFAASTGTRYTAFIDPVVFVRETKTVFFPLQWTRSCISLDSAGRKVALVVDGQLVVIMIIMMMVIVVVVVVMRTMIKVALVVDGQLVGEKEFKKEEIFFRQDSRFNIS